MTLKKHTPGPWMAYKQSNGLHFVGQTGYVGDDAMPVCRILADEREGIEPDGNAALIAAAPELYEALREMLRELDRLAPNNEYPIAINAIAKAEGRS